MLSSIFKDWELKTWVLYNFWALETFASDLGLNDFESCTLYYKYTNTYTKTQKQYILKELNENSLFPFSQILCSRIPWHPSQPTAVQDWHHGRLQWAEHIWQQGLCQRRWSRRRKRKSSQSKKLVKLRWRQRKFKGKPFRQFEFCRNSCREKRQSVYILGQ